MSLFGISRSQRVNKIERGFWILCCCGIGPSLSTVLTYHSILMKLCVAVTPFMVIRLLQTFAYGTTAVLSCYVKKFAHCYNMYETKISIDDFNFFEKLVKWNGDLKPYIKCQCHWSGKFQISHNLFCLQNWFHFTLFYLNCCNEALGLPHPGRNPIN